MCVHIYIYIYRERGHFTSQGFDLFVSAQSFAMDSSPPHISAMPVGEYITNMLPCFDLMSADRWATWAINDQFELVKFSRWTVSETVPEMTCEI